MRGKKQKRRNLAGLMLALLVALSAVILARTAAHDGGGEVSTTPAPTPGEAFVIDQPTVVSITDATMMATKPTPTEEAALPEPVARYAEVSMTEDECAELAALLFLEAGNQCADGQQAVVEVVLNRVISGAFPDTVHDVLHQGEGTAVPQFSTIYNIALAKSGQAQQDAIDAALYGPSILPDDVVFFSRAGENDRVWGAIEDHVFCYAYIWE